MEETRKRVNHELVAQRRAAALREYKSILSHYPTDATAIVVVAILSAYEDRPIKEATRGVAFFANDLEHSKIATINETLDVFREIYKGA
jgi:hypothetical protein